MDTSNLIVTILSSSIVSGAVTSIITFQYNLKSKKKDFEYDHKKYFLKKRIESYEQISSYIPRFYLISNRNNFKIPDVFDDTNDYKNFTIFFNKYYRDYAINWFWYSTELKVLLKSSNVLLNTIHEEYCIQSSEEQRIQIADKYSKQLIDLGFKLHKCYIKDLKELDKVKFE